MKAIGILALVLVVGCSRYADGCWTAGCHLGKQREAAESERRARAEIDRSNAEQAAWEQQQREQARYRECRAFILDVDAAAKDPARADACMNVVIMMDRQREQQRADAEAETARKNAEAEAAYAQGVRELARQQAEDARRDRIVRAIGTAFQPPPAAPPPAYAPTTYGAPPRAAADPGCSSNYDCEVGLVCAKGRFGAPGKCVKPVDENGLKVFGRPQLAKCTFTSDCPIGFRCDSDTKTCLK